MLGRFLGNKTVSPCSRQMVVKLVPLLVIDSGEDTAESDEDNENGGE
jgi:hypothetical protein